MINYYLLSGLVVVSSDWQKKLCVFTHLPVFHLLVEGEHRKVEGAEKCWVNLGMSV